MNVNFKTICLKFVYILSQNYNAAVFHFQIDTISFLVHVLNQLFLPNENSVRQASYRTMILTISFQLFVLNKPFYGGRVVEKNEPLYLSPYLNTLSNSFSQKTLSLP